MKGRFMRSLLRAQLFFLVAVLAWTRAVGALGAEPSPGQPAMETPKALEDEFPEIRQAGEKLRQGDIDGARELLDKLVEAHPELPPAALLMARFFAQANDRAGVRHWLQVAVADEPDDPEAYVLLGDLNMQENRFAEADALYEEALERVEDTQAEDARSRDVALRALVGRSAVAEVRSEWDTARGYLEQVLAERPNDSGVLQRLARVLFQQGKAEEALEKLRAAAKADPTVLTPEATMAQFYEQAG
ncbi:MAG TPA: tetratricopeptide repeat protein, partial [Planctomycetaceae bacterium]|nr:tetratricopeptide repeat protein [Planctomycetaceae bacterium]